MSYVEENYVPIFHLWRTRRLGGRSTPMVKVGPTVLKSSSEILRWAAEQAPRHGRGALYPADPTEARDVQRWEALFDERLGLATRRLAYFYLIDAPALFVVLNEQRLGSVQRAVFRVVAPLLRGLIRRGLRVDARSKVLGEEGLEAVLGEVETALADGRRYLVGNAFTAADLTFAALLSPLLQSDVLARRRGVVYDEALVPAGLASCIAGVRARPAGAFALRMLAEER